MPRWTAAARQKQSEIQKTRQSWKHSTGPKTMVGKARSSRNAYKHGLKSRAAAEIRESLRNHSKFLTYINHCITAARRKKRLDAMLATFNTTSPTPSSPTPTTSLSDPTTPSLPDLFRQSMDPPDKPGDDMRMKGNLQGNLRAFVPSCEKNPPATSPKTFQTTERTRQTDLVSEGQPFLSPSTPAIKASCFP